MNKNNASTISSMKLALAIFVALIGLIFTVMPLEARADYRYYYPNYSYGYYGNNYSGYYYDYGYNGTNYYPGGYYSPSPYYVYNNLPLSVTCTANRTFVPIGSDVTWVAHVSGGNGLYAFSWNGTDGLYGSQSTASAYYNLPGVKTASVYVTSAGQQMNVQCSNTVTVGIASNLVYTVPQAIPVVIAPTTIPTQIVAANTSDIKVACFADTISTKVGIPVTWSVEAVGNGDNFTYAWTGTDGLSGNQASTVTTYNTTGRKSAVVTVTSANGKSQAKACSNTVNVTTTPIPKTVAKAPVKETPTVTPSANKNLSAAAIFSLEYVPWGLVAILVIIILFITVLYLLFNKKKI